MKFQFNPDLDFQAEAIASIVGIFEGQEVCRTNFTVAPLKKEEALLAGLDQNDLGIGQWYDDAVRTMNYVSPMVYPSHYPTGVLKFKNPADHPYEIISDSLKKGNEVIDAAAAGAPAPKIATQRPWLQAFDMGAKYTPTMIAAEVKAARDNHASGFMFWNASNNYDNLPDLTK